MYSKESIAWLNSLNNSNIQHALTGGEVNICGAKVDGFDEKTNTICQYHGCFSHGCNICFKSESIDNKNKESMDDLYKKNTRAK